MLTTVRRFMTSNLCLCLGVASVALAGVTAQQPLLVSDINRRALPTHSYANPGNESSYIQGATGIFVVADDGSHGSELHLVDPATKSSKLLKDIRPGKLASNPSQLRWALGRLWFEADDGVHGRELWVSDGTGPGTRMVTDLNPGTAASQPRGMTACGPLIVFSATESKFGTELYVSDGSAGGTSLLRDFIVGSTSGSPREFVADPTGPRAYFSVDTVAHGRELWITDGTAMGTRIVVDLAPGAKASLPRRLLTVGQKLLFQSDEPALYATDGTAAGTEKLAAIEIDIDSVAHFGRRVYFAATASSGSKSVWVSDGSFAGTRLYFLPRVALPSSTPFVFAAGPASTFAFVIPTGGSQSALFFSDGNLSKTRAVKYFNDHWVWESAIFVGSRLYLAQARHRSQLFVSLWTSDGTTAGTGLVPNRGASGVESPRFLSLVRSTATSSLVFTGSHPEFGEELMTVGAKGIELLVDIRPPDGKTQGSGPLAVTRFGKRLIFSADDGIHGREPWLHDPRTNTSTLLVDLEPGRSSSDPLEYCVLGDRVVFSAHRVDVGRELFVSDGTSAGTHLLADIDTRAGGSRPENLSRVHDKIYFTALTPNLGREMWVTDGTQSGTKFFLNVKSPPAYAIPIGSGGAFVFESLGSGTLWYSDGTPANTFPYIAPYAPLSARYELTAFGDRVVYTAWTPETGHEIAITDGTTAGTGILVDMIGGPTSAYPRDIEPFRQGLLSLWQNPRMKTRTLSYTDGTAQGTVTIPLALSSSTISHLTSAGSRRFFFTNKTAAHGNELWTSDGTTAGTKLLADLHPGPADSLPWNIGVAGRPRLAGLDGSFYFSAEDGVHGRELWRVPVGASSTSVGFGCTTRKRTPTLAADDALIGQNTRIDIHNAAQGSVMLLAIGDIASRAVYPTPGCISEVDLLAPLVVLPAAMTSPSWSATIAVPNDASLRGATLAWQAFFVGGGLSGLEASNAVHMTVDAY